MTVSLGRDLIASLNGTDYPVERSRTGSYVNGVWTETAYQPVNQSLAIAFDDAEADIESNLEDNVEGMEAVGVSGALTDELVTVTWDDVGAQSLLQVVSNTLQDALGNDIDVTIAQETPGDEVTPEVQSITLSDVPAAGELVLSLGAPEPEPPLTVFATEQPLTGRDLVRIEEGDRSRERRKLYSADELFVSREGAGNAADIVTIDGIQFQVENVEKWSGHWKAILVKIEDEES